MARTSISTDNDCGAFAPEDVGKLPNNIISRKHQITNKRLILCAKKLVQNVLLCSQVSQSIMVASAWGIVV